MMTRGVVEATGVVSLLQMVLAVDVVRVLQVRGHLRLFKSGDVVDGGAVVEHALDSLARGKCRPGPLGTPHAASVVAEFHLRLQGLVHHRVALQW